MDRPASSPKPARATSSLQGVLDLIATLGGENAEVSVDDMVDAVGPRAFGPLLLIPSLIMVSPLSGIPGAPTLAALVIVLVGVQMLLGQERVWLPGFVRRRSLRGAWLRSAAKRLRPLARLVDRLVGPRMEFVVRRPFSLVIAAVCIVMAMAMPPLEFVPMSSTVLATGIALLALALTVRDGVLALVSLAAIGLSAALGFRLLT